MQNIKKDSLNELEIRWFHTNTQYKRC